MALDTSDGHPRQHGPTAAPCKKRKGPPGLSLPSRQVVACGVVEGSLEAETKHLRLYPGELQLSWGEVGGTDMISDCRTSVP